jgi:hypothetical protein
MEDQAENFQRHRAQKRLVTRFSEDYGRMSVTLGKADVTFGNGSRNRAAVGPGKSDGAFGRQIERFPDIVRHQGVSRSAVDQKSYGCLLTVGPVRTPSVYVTPICFAPWILSIAPEHDAAEQSLQVADYLGVAGQRGLDVFAVAAAYIKSIIVEGRL